MYMYAYGQQKSIGAVRVHSKYLASKIEELERVKGKKKQQWYGNLDKESANHTKLLKPIWKLVCIPCQRSWNTLQRKYICITIIRMKV